MRVMRSGAGKAQVVPQGKEQTGKRFLVFWDPEHPPALLTLGALSTQHFPSTEGVCRMSPCHTGLRCSKGVKPLRKIKRALCGAPPVLVSAGIQLIFSQWPVGAVFWNGAEHRVDFTEVFLLLLSRAHTEPRPLLIFTLAGW